MAKNKTIETEESVNDYLNNIKDEQRKKDCSKLIALIQNQTGFEPKMWGPAIVGFGSYHYRYESGREGDAPLAAIAARASSIVVYLYSNLENRKELLQNLGKHKTDKGCVHIKKLEDVDETTLLKMIENNITYIRELYLP